MRRNPTGTRGDGLLFFLLLVAALTLPWSLDASQWAPQAYRLITPTILAAVVGFVLARSPLPNWLASLFGTLLGAEYSLQHVGRLLPKWELLWRDARAASAWLWDLVTRQGPQPIEPFAQSLAHVNSQLTTMLSKISVWSQAVSQGVETKDTTFLRLALTFLVWLLVLYATLELMRYRRTLHAFLPLGLAVISNVSYTGLGITYVYIYLAAVLLAMVWARATRLEYSWILRGIDFSSHLRSQAMSTGAFLSVAIIVFALSMPYMRLDRAADYFWSNYGTSFESFYDRMDRAFAGRNPVITPTPAPSTLGSHYIYESPELENTTVFRVTTSDPAPVPLSDGALDPWYDDQYFLDEYIEDVPKRYWRERTYDTYTGRGWANSTQEADDWAAGIAWKLAPEATSPLTQTFRIVGATPGYGFAASEPVVVDQPYTIITREAEDLIAFSVGTDLYSVVSRVPEATVDDLQADEAPYPDEVAARYLSLEGIPEEVQALAQEIVDQVGAETRYEKALAIQTYLRQFEYDLDVPPAPAGEDLTSYFLFDAKRGFCDYSASTMVVMLRSVGVATRYASGFSMGFYDDRTEEWVVLESNSHAWPEVYFPGYGWIEFEPTPAQSVFTRPTATDDGEELSLAPPPPVERPEPVEDVTLPPYWWLTVLVIVVIVAALLLAPRFLSRSKRSPAQSVWRAYRNLLNIARWLGLGPRGGQTPHEFMTGLNTALLARSQGDGRMPASDVALIEHAYERLRYSETPVTREEASSAERAYRRLRGPLLRLLFRRPNGRARTT